MATGVVRCARTSGYAGSLKKNRLELLHTVGLQSCPLTTAEKTVIIATSLKVKQLLKHMCTALPETPPHS